MCKGCRGNVKSNVDCGKVAGSMCRGCLGNVLTHGNIRIIKYQIECPRAGIRNRLPLPVSIKEQVNMCIREQNLRVIQNKCEVIK